jgi:UPF0716 protein FxsA
MVFRWVAVILGIIALGLPLLELVGIYQVWGVAGWWTLAWLALSALAGIWLMALERLAFLPRMVASLANGGAPFGVLTGSGLRFVAAALLIFPGFFSDAVAVLLLLYSLLPGRARPVAAGRGQQHAPRAANEDIIEGEYRRVD